MIVNDSARPSNREQFDARVGWTGRATFMRVIRSSLSRGVRREHEADGQARRAERPIV